MGEWLSSHGHDLAPEAQSGTPRGRQEEQVEQPSRQAEEVSLGGEPGEQETSLQELLGIYNKTLVAR